MTVYPLEFARPSAASARRHLSDLRALLALSMLMAEAAGEDDILELAAEAVATLTGCSVEGIYIGDGQWRRAVTPFDGLALRAYLQDGGGRGRGGPDRWGASVPCRAPGGAEWQMPALWW